MGTADNSLNLAETYSDEDVCDGFNFDDVLGQSVVNKDTTTPVDAALWLKEHWDCFTWEELVAYYETNSGKEDYEWLDTAIAPLMVSISLDEATVAGMQGDDDQEEGEFAQLTRG